jgi:hypothetical protein
VGGVLAFVGCGRVLGHVAPSAIAGLQAARCRFVLCSDNAATDDSVRRGLREESLLPPARRRLLDTHAAAALFSLAGVQSVVLRQWAATPHDATALLQRAATAWTQPDDTAITDFVRAAKAHAPLRERFNLVLYGLPHARIRPAGVAAVDTSSKAKAKQKK